MMMKTRLVLGWIMILLGAYVAVHLLWSHGKPVTTSLWLDMAFAAVFLLAQRDEREECPTRAAGRVSEP